LLQIYVGGLDPNATEDELRKAFAKYGDLASVKIPVGKQCGFVQFVNRPDAEEALQGLNGSTIGKQAVRLSWGRSPASKQVGTFDSFLKLLTLTLIDMFKT
jgi:RNA recognition motif-containing protein